MSESDHLFWTAASRIVAIVPVHDGGDDIAYCLAGLVAAGQEPADILVIDDASSDGAALAASCVWGTRHVRLGETPSGPGHARNCGAKLAEGADILLFVDADVVIHNDAIMRFRQLLEGESKLIAAFGSYDDSPPATGFVSRYKNLLHHWMHQHGEPEACTFWSGCGAVRRDAFLAAGGFDENFSNASIEDVELGLRLTDRGHLITLSRDVLCTHRKIWTLVGWLRTDIFLRALPWSRLLVTRGRGIPNTLNLGRRERLSALCALFVAAGAGLIAFAPLPGGSVIVTALFVFIALQWRLLYFFLRRQGVAFTIAAILMHLCYFVCASVIYTGVKLWAVLTKVLPSAYSRS